MIPIQASGRIFKDDVKGFASILRYLLRNQNLSLAAAGGIAWLHM
jgi:hypothetical protein